MRMELRQEIHLECAICKHKLGVMDEENFTILIEGAQKYYYCPSCGGSAPKAKTANGWIRWCAKVDRFIKNNK